MTEFMSVKNFETFQHYKDRSPVWIKLYRSLLADYRFSRLQDASKSHLILIWLLASECDNRIPYDAQWIAQRISATEVVDLKCLIDNGFLVLDKPEPVASVPVPKREPREEKRQRERENWLTPFWVAWRAQYGADPVNGGAMAKYLRPVWDELGPAESLVRWTRYLGATKGDYATAARFASIHGTYKEPEVKLLTDDNGLERPHRKNEAGEWVPT